MKKFTKPSKLSLDTQTIAVLVDDQLALVAGGADSPFKTTVCTVSCLTCTCPTQWCTIKA